MARWNPLRIIWRLLGIVPDAEPVAAPSLPRRRERVPDSRSSIPDDANIEIVRVWSPTDSKQGRYKTAPYGGWTDGDIRDENQVLVRVTSKSNGLDYYRTIMGPFANKAIASIYDLIEAEFWNSSP